jgi:glycogen operon protein
MSLRALLDQRLITWHGVKLNEPDWAENSHSIAFTVQSLSGSMAMHYIINAYSEPLTFELPRLTLNPDHTWKRWIDTNLPSPQDICKWDEAPEANDFTYSINAYSLAILIMRI